MKKKKKYWISPEIRQIYTFFNYGLLTLSPKVCFSVLPSAFLRSFLLIWFAKLCKNSPTWRRDRLEKRKNIQKIMIFV